MPTAPKLVAALFFALLGFFVADLVKPLLPEGTRTGLLNEVVAVVGLILGWTVQGSRAGDGNVAALGYGLTTVALMAFWAVVIFSGTEMIQNSIDRRYGGPMQAIQSMFGIAIRQFRLIMTPSIIVSMVVGAWAGGWITEWSSKRWN